MVIHVHLEFPTPLGGQFLPMPQQVLEVRLRLESPTAQQVPEYPTLLVVLLKILAVPV